MCLLVVKPRGVRIADSARLCELATASNPDGFGVAWPSRGTILTMRGTGYDTRQQSKTIDKIGERAAIFHWRYATGGAVNQDNCHPFRIADGTVFAHNGVFPIVASKTHSDTRIIAEASADFDDLSQRVAPYIGRGNKVAFLSPKLPDDPVILGEEHGDWIDGAWYSNTNWMDRYSWLDDLPTVGTALGDRLYDLVREYGVDAVLDAAYQAEELIDLERRGRDPFRVK